MAREKPTILAFVRNSPEHGLSAVHYYRVFLPVNTIKEKSKYFDVTIITQSSLKNLIEDWGPHADKLLAGRDVYVISRLYQRQGLHRFIDVLHESGGKIVFDTDDDLTDDFRAFGRGDEFVETVRAMDLVTVSTPFLSRRMEEYLGYRPPVLENYVDFGWFSKTSLRAPRVVSGLSVGFVGTASHEGDWIYPVEALIRLSEEHDITITVAGFFPSYMEGLKKTRKFKGVPYDQYPELVRQFDIVCCSLDPDDKFNLSKSGIKAIEAMAAARRLPNGALGGAVPVCTDMPVYRRVVGHRGNGLLVDNDSWYEVLKELVVDSKFRHGLSKKGYCWAKNNRDIQRGYTDWLRLYKRVVDGRALYSRRKE